MIRLECKQLVRSKWVQIVTVLFVVIFISILMIQHLAMPDVTGFTRQSASLLNILLFLLPLFMLTIGSMNIASDVETGWFGLLKTYPLKVRHYTMTKYIALCSVFSGIVILAISMALLIGGFLGGIRLPLYFVLLTVMMIMIFNAISLLIGSLAKNRLHALAIGLGIWSLFTLLYSYIVMAIGTVVAEHILRKLVMVLMHLNPLEWIRFSYFLWSKQTAVLGPAFYDISTFYQTLVGIGVYMLVTAVWIVLPLSMTSIVLKNRGQK
ncbi:ABC transporter permease [Domibacillus mangrovi]|uniref:ABC transporter permease n=1 Tax=Domibacillus mangrovi TaxID=1714354 RepID=A0A1Q5P4E0_9BACI|nr:ABC transporter permease subunit [Domibacillus mangrovi]OKL36962.1 ABC transporter permease [Domibacillus mangrovi]